MNSKKETLVRQWAEVVNNGKLNYDDAIHHAKDLYRLSSGTDIIPEVYIADSILSAQILLNWKFNKYRLNFPNLGIKTIDINETPMLRYAYSYLNKCNGFIDDYIDVWKHAHFCFTTVVHPNDFYYILRSECENADERYLLDRLLHGQQGIQIIDHNLIINTIVPPAYDKLLLDNGYNKEIVDEVTRIEEHKKYALQNNATLLVRKFVDQFSKYMETYDFNIHISLSSINFLIDMELKGKLDEKSQCLKNLMMSGISQALPFSNFIVLVKMPKYIKKKKNQLHCEDGPAIEYVDGFCQHYWNGCYIPSHWMEHKHIPKAERLRYEKNPAMKQVIGEFRMKYGTDHG